jgi:RimJ/RimL family protein N-acetyltransferase
MSDPSTVHFVEPAPLVIAETLQFRLRTFRRSDLPAFERIFCNPEVSRSFRALDWAPLLPATWVEGYLALLHAPEYAAFAACTPGDDQLFGSIIARFGEAPMSTSAEIAGWMQPSLWRSGTARRVNEAFVEWLFRDRGVLRAYAYAFHPNKAAIGSLRAAGYRLEGRERCIALKDGKVMDRLVFVRLNPAATTLPRAPDREAEWLRSGSARRIE